MPLMSTIISLRMKQKGIGWYGDYGSWEEALKDTTGYGSDAIFKAVKKAALAVKRGEAAYERDGFTFKEEKFNFPLLAALFFAGSGLNLPEVHITDFGGSLASVYFQHKKILDQWVDYRWHIVEQEGFVKTGKEHFESNRLRFFLSLEELQEFPGFSSDIILLSSVLQYLPDPHAFLDKIMEKNFRYIVLDSMPFFPGYKNRLSIQKTANKYYRSSYPCYLLSEPLLLERIEKKYRRVMELPSDLFIYVEGRKVPYKGFLFERNHE
jgi:putative methyltransferase (TIGR04325 family)